MCAEHHPSYAKHVMANVGHCIMIRAADFVKPVRQCSPAPRSFVRPRCRAVGAAGTLLLVAAIALVPWGTGGLWAQPLGEHERVATAAPDEEAADEAPLPQTEVGGNAAADGEAERPLLREAGWGADEHGKSRVRVWYCWGAQTLDFNRLLHDRQATVTGAGW